MEEQFDWKKRINIDPAIQGGKPVIAGRRVPVEVVVGALAAGDSIEEVCAGYVITIEDVRAALAFANYVLTKQPVDALPS